MYENHFFDNHIRSNELQFFFLYGAAKNESEVHSIVLLREKIKTMTDFFLDNKSKNSKKNNCRNKEDGCK